jgi:hypothetical protein
MAVTMQDTGKEEPPQSIALELARCGRYIRLGDTTVYEKGVVYDVAFEYANELLRLTDDFGFPIFVRERSKGEAAKRKVEAEEAAKHPRSEVRAPQRRQSAKPGPVSARKVELGDADDDVDTRLKNIDAAGAAEVPVKV